ncbi:hypothetical protein KAFR_0H03050 [Kazachstania africana CBS 2517]|uniref:Citrate synthase n=1 Tax=Kazachstania africana (strain ATCC 22294 / BCRC 22015 / CBS 2517 / CECT 1963 / NBRC 1671 / NRRL Y-8276) TaxID=1071382 RepID=H2AZF9_KAZAF|nr:hypothetical protein KAFR_0H03050 [Kazachstania africana CBS 2517]CCF59715.1 hypothetical protein KAFR_0H03050 [Kazachstania africana CBS 2517]
MPTLKNPHPHFELHTTCGSRNETNTNDSFVTTIKKDSTLDAGQEKTLKEKFSEIIPYKVQELQALKKEYGNRVISEVSVEQVLGGMRGINSILWDGSLLDPIKGIELKGYTIPEIKQYFPKETNSEEPLPEALFWLFLTGEIPTKSEAKLLSKELSRRASVPDYVIEILNRLPKTLHPMVQLSIAVAALDSQSKFNQAYSQGVSKTNYWIYTYEDVLDLLAMLPILAAKIYANTFKDGQLGAFDPDADYAKNFATLLGYDNNDFIELMRLYLTIHADHEGGNVSAHTTHLVGSTLTSPYLAFSAALDGLSGPLHGGANQEVLEWLLNLKEKLNGDYSEETIEAHLWDTLNSGRVIPGYGHAVLRRTDPRYLTQREFASKHFPDYDLFRLVSAVYNVAPAVLTKHGKSKNPWPNVDAHSGVLLQYYGLTEVSFYTVLFGVSRAFGVLSQLIIDRAIGAPIERPKSLTTQRLKEIIQDVPKVKSRM